MDKDIIGIYRKLTGERDYKPFLMRMSEAQILRNLSPSMIDARHEIERGFRLSVVSAGYTTTNIERVDNGSSGDLKFQEWQQDQVSKFREWANRCSTKFRGIVLDMTVFGFTARQTASQRGITRQTVMKRFHKGLNEYCIIQGWGDQLNNNINRS